MHRRSRPHRDPISAVHDRAWLIRHTIGEAPFFTARGPEQEGAQHSVSQATERTELVANSPTQRADYGADNRIG